MVTLGIVADPGVPTRIAEWLLPELSEAIAASTADQNGSAALPEWEVETAQDVFPVNESGIPLVAHAEKVRQREGWDYILYLTDLPLTHEREQVQCEVNAQARAALIVVPAFGALRLRRRLRSVIVDVVLEMHGHHRAGALGGRGKRRFAERFAAGDTGEHHYLVMRGWLSKPRLLAGMVRCNRPSRLFSALQNAIAAALATGAFGIFYASIWNMADALHPLRLLAIGLIAIAALSTWLIAHNGLWNARRHAPLVSFPRTDNVSTVVTIGLSVTMMYVLLHVVLFCGSLAVIANDFLADQLGHEVSLLDYFELSWLATSMVRSPGPSDRTSIAIARYGRRRTAVVKRSVGSSRNRSSAMTHDAWGAHAEPECATCVRAVPAPATVRVL